MIRKICFQICLIFFLLQVMTVIGGESEVHRGHPRSKRSANKFMDIYTLDHFIELVEKIERHPLTKTKSLGDIANYIRKLGYDSVMWTYLVGKTGYLPDRVLTAEEKRVLTNMIAHHYIWSRELGVVKTPNGNVAMGHVITGICAGINRQKKLTLSSIAGLPIDNLYAATISGDLGQTFLFKQINQQRPLLGPGGSWSPNTMCPAIFNNPTSSRSGATDAELLGDIDGFLLGYDLPKYVSRKVRLGQLLRMYYSSGILYDTSFASCKRNEKFKQLVSKDVLTSQVQGFAKGYKWVWYGSTDFSSVKDSDIPQLAATTTDAFFKYVDNITPNAACPKPNNEGCELPANIIFVMDDSGSIGRLNYEIEKKFVTNVIDAFEVSPIQTRVAVIEYASSAWQTIGLDYYGSKTTLKCAVYAIPHNGGGTNTAGAVTLAYGIMKDEERKTENSVQQIMILLTDGRSNDRYALEQAAKFAKANLQDVTMIAVGVGNYQRQELELIATDPKNHVLTSTDFGHLINLVKTLRKKTCEAPARLTISLRVGDGENKTAVIGFVSPGKSRFYAMPAELFYGLQNVDIEITPYFGTIYVYASRVNKNPGPGNYTFRLAPKGSSRKRRSTDYDAGAGQPLNLHVQEICRGYNETTCPPLYMAIQGRDSKLSCHDSHCTLPNQIKFRITKGNPPSRAEWLRGTPLVLYLAFIHYLMVYIWY